MKIWNIVSDIVDGIMWALPPRILISVVFLIAFIVALLYGVEHAFTQGVVKPPKEKLRDYRIVRVLDGDTVEIEAPYLPSELRDGGLKLRILGIDTPEKGFRAKCAKENMRSLQAKYFVDQEVSHAKEIKVWIKEWDKYGGRVLGDLMLDGDWLSDKMIKNKFAVPYFGEKKEYDWCKK